MCIKIYATCNHGSPQPSAAALCSPSSLPVAQFQGGCNTECCWVATGNVTVPPNLTQQEGHFFAIRLGKDLASLPSDVAIRLGFFAIRRCSTWHPLIPSSGPSASGLQPTVGSMLDPYGSPVMQRQICLPVPVGLHQRIIPRCCHDCIFPFQFFATFLQPPPTFSTPPRNTEPLTLNPKP